MKNFGKTLTRLEIGKALDLCAKDSSAACMECPFYECLPRNGLSCMHHVMKLASAAIGEDLGIISDLVDDFGSYVYDGVPNPAPYCSNACTECVDARGWCKEDRDGCKGFEANVGNINGEVSEDDARRDR